MNSKKTTKIERRAILIAILKWLYINDGEYETGSDWRIALIKFLEDLLS